MEFLYLFWYGVWAYIKPILKWFLRRTTSLCELQRICYGELPGAIRTRKIEKCLENSKSFKTQEVLRLVYEVADANCVETEEEKRRIENLLKQVLIVKEIKSDLHKEFVRSFKSIIRQLCSYRHIVAKVESVRKTVFDQGNEADQHEEKLCKLWSCLQPQTPTPLRISSQWTLIGFQGNNPATDFRGMGLLSLENLLFFVEEYSGAARHVFSHSKHPKYGYSFAIVGIQITSLAYNFLVNQDLMNHMFNLMNTEANSNKESNCIKMRHFYHFFVYLFVEFDKFWLSQKPKDIMEFGRLFSIFANNIRTNLADQNVCLKLNLAVDCI